MSRSFCLRAAIVIAILVEATPNAFAWGRCSNRAHRFCRAVPQRCRFRGRQTIPLDRAIAAVLHKHGLTPSTIPSAPFTVQQHDPLIPAIKWAEVRNELEHLLKRYGVWDSDLPLELKVVRGKIDDRAAVYQFVVPRSTRQVRDALKNALALTEANFADFKIVFETLLLSSVQINEKIVKNGKEVQLVKNGEPLLPEILHELQEMLLQDKQLAALAADLGGAIKTIAFPNQVTSNRLLVLTEWQPFEFHSDHRKYWRVNVSLTREDASHWNLVSMVDVGRLYRSQAKHQLTKITDTNQLGSTVHRSTVVPDGQHARGQTTLAVSKPIGIGNDQVTTPEDVSRLAQLSQLLWRSVASLLVADWGAHATLETATPQPPPVSH